MDFINVVLVGLGVSAGLGLAVAVFTNDESDYELEDDVLDETDDTKDETVNS